jgi:hypothetical protein
VIGIAVVVFVAAGAIDAAAGVADFACWAIAVAEADSAPSADSALAAEEPGRTIEVTAALDIWVGLDAAREVALTARRAVLVAIAATWRQRDADSCDASGRAGAVFRSVTPIGDEAASVVAHRIRPEERAALVLSAHPRRPADRVVATPQRGAPFVIAAGDRNAATVLAPVIVWALRIDVALWQRLAGATGAVRRGRAVIVARARLPTLTRPVDAESVWSTVGAEVALPFGDALSSRELAGFVVVTVAVVPTTGR